MPDYKYLVQFPDGSNRTVSQEEFDAKKEELFTKFPEAKAVRVGDFTQQEKPTAANSYRVQFPDGSERTVTGDVFGKKKDEIYENFPNVKVDAISPVKWSNGRVYTVESADEAKAKLKAFNDANGEFMHGYEAQESAASRQAGMSMAGNAYNSAQQYVNENRDKYVPLKQQRDAVLTEYFNNPFIREEMEGKAKTAGELHDEYKANIKNAANGRERRDWRRAAKMMDDARKLYDAPNKFVKGVDDENGFTHFMKSYWNGVKDVGTDADFWSMGLTEISRNIDLRGIVKKLDAAAEQKGSELTENDIDGILSESEKAELDAWAKLAEAQEKRAYTLSGAYSAGQGSAESVMFMAQFLLTQGWGNAIGKGLAGSKNAIASYIGRSLMTDRALARAVAPVTEGLSAVKTAKVMTRAAQTARNIAAAEETISRAGKVGGKVLKFGDRVLAKPIIQGAWHTIAPTQWPANLQNITQKALETGGGTQVDPRSLGKTDSGIIGVGKAFRLGLLDAFIENWSESIGGAFDGVSLNVLDKMGGNFGRYARWMWDSPVREVAVTGGFNGLVGEMAEEWIGNAARIPFGLMTKEEFGRFGGDIFSKDENKRAAAIESQLEMAASFGPMSIIGLGGSIRGARAKSKAYDKQVEKVKEILDRNGVGSAAIDNIFDQRFDSAKEVAEKLSPYVESIYRNGTSDEQKAKDYKEVMKLADLIGQRQTLRSFEEIQRDDDRIKMRQSIEATAGTFWRTSESEAKDPKTGDPIQIDHVHAIEYADGHRVFIIGEDAEGRMIGRDETTGGVVYMDRDKYEADKESGEIVDDQEDMPINDYLDKRIAEMRSSEETQRMEDERRQKIEDVKRRAMETRTVQMGTAEAPVVADIVATSSDGVMVRYNDTEEFLSWASVAEKMGTPITVKTDAEQESDLAEMNDKADERVEKYKGIVAGTQMTARVDLGDGQYEETTFRYDSCANEDGIVLFYGKDEEGNTVSFAEDAIVDLDKAVNTSEVNLDSEPQVGDVVTYTTEDGSSAKGVLVVADNGSGEAVVKREDGVDAIVNAADIKADEAPVDETPDVPKDFNGNPIPLKDNGDVDQKAFWNDNPEGWTRWNDERRKDGGANSAAYVQTALRSITSEREKKQQQYDSETDFDKRDALEQDLAGMDERIAVLNALADNYARRAEETAEEQAPVEETPAESPAEAPAETAPVEEEKPTADAEIPLHEQAGFESKEALEASIDEEAAASQTPLTADEEVARVEAMADEIYNGQDNERETEHDVHPDAEGVSQVPGTGREVAEGGVAESAREGEGVRGSDRIADEGGNTADLRAEGNAVSGDAVPVDNVQGNDALSAERESAAEPGGLAGAEGARVVDEAAGVQGAEQNAPAEAGAEGGVEVSDEVETRYSKRDQRDRQDEAIGVVTGRTKEQVKTERQKRRVRRRADKWRKLLGDTFQILESEEDIDRSDMSDSRKAEMKQAVTGDAKAAGWYFTGTGKAYLYLPNIKSEGEVDMKVIHEVLSHKGLRGLLGEEGFNKLCDEVWEQTSDTYKKQWLDYNLTEADRKAGLTADSKKATLSQRRAAADEHIAHVVEAREELKQNEGTWKKIVARVKEILNDFLGEDRFSVSDRKEDDIDRLIQSAMAMYIKQKNESSERLSDKGVASSRDEARFSVRYIPRTDEERDEIIRDLVETTGVERERAERWLQSELSLASIILSEDNSPYLNYEADSRFKAIKDNSDYPQGTVDFNNICRKRLPFTYMYQQIQKQFPYTIITGEDLATIRNIMRDHDLMVACGLCYVEDRRQLLGEVAKEFIDGIADGFKSYSKKPGADTQKKGKPTNKQKKAKEFIELIGEDKKEDLSIYDLITVDGSAKLAEEHPGIYAAFQAFNSARGQGAQNLFQGYAEYKREILSWSEADVKKVNDLGGLRIFSYSDFEAHHLIDIVQIVQDCAAKGVKIQGYTKVPAFARAIANTNIKINRSLIPLGDTGMVDGKLAYDPVEGIDVNDPDFLESNDNVGNILIGINDEQIRLAMADPFVHFIIPYHTRQAKALRVMKQTGAWTNYVSSQNEKNISDGKVAKKNINIYTDVLNAAEKEGHPITNEREFTERFISVAKERGLVPRFAQFLNTDADGNYVFTPGYAKFLVDFKMFDENGNILEQKPVVAEFDDEFNKRILDDYVAGEVAKLGENYDSVYEEIVDKLGLKTRAADIVKERLGLPVEGETRHSKKTDKEYLDAVASGDMETAQRLVDQAARFAFPNSTVRDGDGNLIPVYHDTNSKRYVNRETGQDWESLDWEERDAWERRDDWDQHWEERDFYTFDRRNARTSIEMPAFFFATEEDPYHEYGERTIKAYINLTNPVVDPVIENAGVTNTAGADAMQKYIDEGHDGFVRIDEDGKPYEYGVFDANNIKSAEPVTYDDNGDVIPLSERFNPEEDDIRFSVAYHGSKADFSEFSLDNFQYAYPHPYALYFTDKLGLAIGYSGNNGYVYEVDIPDNLFNMEDPLVGDELARIREYIEGKEDFPKKATALKKIGKRYGSRYAVVDYLNFEDFRNLGYKGIARSWGSAAFHPGDPMEMLIFDPADVKIISKKKSADSEQELKDRLSNGGNDNAVRFSKANNNQRVFISNAEAALGGIQMEKATPEQWLKMLEGKGGLKAGEDKWIGLSDWIREQDRKTITKQEIADYIAQNQIRIEDVDYAENVDIEAEMREDIKERIGDGKSLDELQREIDRLIASDEYRRLSDDYEKDTWLLNQMKSRYGDDFEVGYYIDEMQKVDYNIDPDALDEFGRYKSGAREINSIRKGYTTQGLDNKREIALTVPTIEPYNESDKIHFGDAGEGRAVAWIRFGDTTTENETVSEKRAEYEKARKELDDHKDSLKQKYADSDKPYYEACTQQELERLASLKDTERALYKELESARRSPRRVLVIDEIQSKRHQDARERGYRSSIPAYENPIIFPQNLQVTEDELQYHTTFRGVTYDVGKGVVGSVDEAKAYFERLINRDIALRNDELGSKKLKAVPDAPFEKNWHELAMKRMLRLAAEEGYDYVAWTTGEQQAERYNIGGVVKKIVKSDDYNIHERTFAVIMNDGNGSQYLTTDDDGNVVTTIVEDFRGKNLSEIFGKELAIRMLSMKEGDTIEEEGLRIGGEGMKGFYDQILPRFMDKYGKKWDVKTEDISLPNLEKSARTMHAVPVTEAMKESVMEGQVMFSKLSPVGDALNSSGISLGNPDVMKEYHLSALDLSKHGDVVTLSRIVAEKPGEGEGSRFMEDLAGLADQNGWTLALTPDDSFGATSVSRLKKFYKRFGFKENKGRNTDYSINESMIRRPAGDKGENALTRQKANADAVASVDRDGIAGLVGAENELDFYKGIVDALPAELRSGIMDIARQNGFDIKSAAKEYIAAKAGMGFENDPTGELRLFSDILRYYSENGELLDDATARYALWKNGQEGGIMTDLASAANKQRWGVGKEGEVRFSKGDLSRDIASTRTEISDVADDAAIEKKEGRRAIAGDLLTAARAMAVQKAYDKRTVELITKTARQLLKEQEIDKMSRAEVARLLGIVNAANGKSPAAVKKYGDALVDAIIKHLVKSEKQKLEDMLKIRGGKVNASGVEVQGVLDVRGQNILKAFKKGLDMRPAEKGMEAEKYARTIDGRIAKLEDTIAEIDDRIEQRNGAVSSSDDALRKNAEDEIQGLELAKKFQQTVKESMEEELGINEALADARAQHERGEISGSGMREIEADTNMDLRENAIERIEAYRSIREDLEAVISKSRSAAKDFLESEKKRKNDIYHNANSDLEGIPVNKDGDKNAFVNTGLSQTVFGPLGTLENILKMFGRYSPNGRGYLYDRYYIGARRAMDNEIVGLEEAFGRLDKKCNELFGCDFRNLPKYIGRLERESDNAFEITFYDRGEKTTMVLPMSNLLYVYMVNKMSDGRVKLRAMGIDESSVKKIEAMLDPSLIKFADWVQGEFLSDLRNKYNAVHERIFGASMAAIENYFPLKIDDGSIQKQEDLDEAFSEIMNPSAKTGAIIKRTRNIKPIDIKNADAIDILSKHVEEMEHWAAWAEWNRDAATLLSYNRFKNRVKAMHTVLGTGKDLLDNVRKAFFITSGIYRPKRSRADRFITTGTKTLATAKVALRLNTALKQIESIIAFMPDVSIKGIANAMKAPGSAWNWAVENMPSFRARIGKGNAGNEKLTLSDEDLTDWYKRLLAKAGEIGLWPNKMMDGLTVAIGSRAVYETALDRYLLEGFSEEDAKRKALEDAETSFNSTQQSSEGAFLSPVQTDRDFWSSSISVFRNSNFAYGRRALSAARRLGKRLAGGSAARAATRERMIEFEKKKLIREGLDEAKAEAAAISRVDRAMWHDIVDTATLGAIINVGWALMSNMWYLLFGDDDDDKERIWKGALAHAVTGFIEGLSFGNLVANEVESLMSGKGFLSFQPHLAPIMSDLESMFRSLKNDKVKGANDVVNLLIQIGIGWNPQTITDVAVAIIDASNGDLGLAKEIAYCMMRIGQVPQSQIKKLWIDEINMSAEDAKKLSPRELAERYAEYSLNRETATTGWMYSDEKRNEKIQNKAKKLLDDAKKE